MVITLTNGAATEMGMALQETLHLADEYTETLDADTRDLYRQHRARLVNLHGLLMAAYMAQPLDAEEDEG